MNISLTLGIQLVIFATLLGGTASFFLKKGAMNLTRNILDVFKNKEIILGIGLYGISSIFFITGLKGGELSVLYPIGSLSYVWGTILAVKFLKEKISPLKIAGILTIILGVVLIGIGR